MMRDCCCRLHSECRTIAAPPVSNKETAYDRRTTRTTAAVSLVACRRSADPPRHDSGPGGKGAAETDSWRLYGLGRRHPRGQPEVRSERASGHGSTQVAREGNEPW